MSKSRTPTLSTAYGHFLKTLGVLRTELENKTSFRNGSLTVGIEAAYNKLEDNFDQWLECKYYI